LVVSLGYSIAALCHIYSYILHHKYTLKQTKQQIIWLIMAYAAQ